MLSILPSSLLTTVLTQWVNLRDIAHLDSACCETVIRSEFLNEIQQPHFVFSTKHERFDRSNMIICWLATRLIRVTHFTFHVNAKYDEDIKMLLRFQQQSQRELKSIHFVDHRHNEETIDKLIKVVAEYAPIQCAELILHKVAMSESVLLDLLSKLPELKVLWVDISNFKAPLSKSVRLPALQDLHIVSHCQAAYDPRSMVQMSANLLLLELSGINLCGCDIEAVARHCPGLQSLSLHDSVVNDADLVTFSRLCPQIVHLDLSGHWAGEGSNFIETFQNLRLESLSINHGSFSDPVMAALIVNQCYSLQELQMCELQASTVSLLYLIGACDRLTTLHLHDSDLLDFRLHIIDSDGSSALSSITHLYVHSDINVKPSVISCIAIMCPHVQFLFVDCGHDEYLQELKDVLKCCKQLHTVRVLKMRTKLRQQLLQIRPQLKIEIHEVFSSRRRRESIF